MKNETLSRTFHFLALMVVSVIVVWGFILVGSPSFNRKLAADTNRLEDLRQLSLSVEQYFYRNKKLPDSLMNLEEVRSSYGSKRRLSDPTSKKPYDFKLKTQYSYELCAEFELSSKEAELENRPSHYFDARSGANWEHDIGHHCFSLEIPVGERNSKVD